MFPEPPPGHPLFDAEGQKKLQQFRELASSLHHWIKEHIVVMQDRNFPNTLIEMKRWVDCQPVIILSVVQIFDLYHLYSHDPSVKIVSSFNQTDTDVRY